MVIAFETNHNPFEPSVVGQRIDVVRIVLHEKLQRVAVDVAGVAGESVHAGGVVGDVAATESGNYLVTIRLFCAGEFRQLEGAVHIQIDNGDLAGIAGHKGSSAILRLYLIFRIIQHNFHE